MKEDVRFDENILQIMPSEIKKMLLLSTDGLSELYEIRFRINKPMIFITDKKELFIRKDGKFTNNIMEAYYIKNSDIKELLEYVSRYSIYAYEDEIRQGFITIAGGHRIGITGKVVMDGEKIKMIKNISCVNIRISHEVIGCADRIIPYIFDDNKKVLHTLIISPPRCGKTTLLRDIIRQISDGNDKRSGVNVGVVDERSEIGACYMGVPQNEIGIRTDILDCCPKSEGMMMLIRSMSPEIIAVDEIGGKADMDAIEYIINCGCKLLATIHGSSIEDILSKPVIGKIVRNRVFDRYIILRNTRHPGRIESIFDSRGSILWEGERIG